MPSVVCVRADEEPLDRTSYRVLEHIASSEEDAHSFYNCPVCRKPQLMGVDSLQVCREMRVGCKAE
jgi:hypothetical protein